MPGQVSALVLKVSSYSICSFRPLLLGCIHTSAFLVLLADLFYSPFTMVSYGTRSVVQICEMQKSTKNALGVNPTLGALKSLHVCV